MDNFLNQDEPRKAKVKDKEQNFPFVLYALWSPNKQGYIAGMPSRDNDENIVRDNEVKYKQIKLFITEEHAQDYIDDMIDYLNNPDKKYRMLDGDINTIRKLLIVRLEPSGWQKPLIHPN